MQITITSTNRPSVAFMEALEGFVKAMEPEADFTIKLEVPDCQLGNWHCYISYSIKHCYVHTEHRRKRPRMWSLDEAGPSTLPPVVQPPTISSSAVQLPTTQPLALQCPECFQSPCVILNPPTFLKGSCAPHARNVHKRYALYRRFYTYLKTLGLWRSSRYLEKKRVYTPEDDPREIMPWCIRQVLYYKYNYVQCLLYTYTMLYRSSGVDFLIHQDRTMWDTRLLLISGIKPGSQYDIGPALCCIMLHQRYTMTLE